jgi:hypothetical protein
MCFIYDAIDRNCTPATAAAAAEKMSDKGLPDLADGFPAAAELPAAHIEAHNVSVSHRVALCHVRLAIRAAERAFAP